MAHIEPCTPPFKRDPGRRNLSSEVLKPAQLQEKVWIDAPELPEDCFSAASLIRVQGLGFRVSSLGFQV